MPASVNDRGMPYIVGLTGGIGSGKSTVSRLFAERGAGVIDTDTISHALTTSGGQAMPAIIAAFGPEFVQDDGALDRNKMRHTVFTDPLARNRLESILHPLIEAETDRQCQSSLAPYVILVVPLLTEHHTYRQRCNRILVIDCAPSEQIGRVVQRSALTRAEAARIVAAQATREARLAIADDVVDNSGEIANLNAGIDALHRLYLAAAGNHGRNLDVMIE